MPNKTTSQDKKYLKVLKQKDNLLFHLLILMSVDSEKNYVIAKKDASVVKKAMRLYVKPLPSNHEHIK